MITPRTTRLVRVADLQAFRRALATWRATARRSPRATASSSCRRAPRPRSCAAASRIASLCRTRRTPWSCPTSLPTSELVTALAQRLDRRPRSCRTPNARRCSGSPAAPRAPPAPSRRSGCGPASSPRCCASTTRCDATRRSVDTFERLALGMLEPGAADDRGAERLVRQTRFLVAAFREFEARSGRRRRRRARRARRLLQSAAPRARTVTSSSRSATARSIRYGPGPGGLGSAGARAGPRAARRRGDRPRTWPARSTRRCTSCCPGSTRCALDQRRRRPDARAAGAAERRARASSARPRGGGGRLRAAGQGGPCAPGRWPASARAALVVHQPLPYVYVTREVLARGRRAVPDVRRAAAGGRAVARPRSTWCCRPSAPTSRAGPPSRSCASPHLRSAPVGGASPRDVDGLDRALAEQAISVIRPRCARLVERVGAAKPSSAAAMARAARAGRVLARLRRASWRRCRSRVRMAAHLRHAARVSDRARARRRGPDDPACARGSCGPAARSLAR